jgi:hypothetical protein
MSALALVRATMLIAAVLWAWAEVLKIRRPRDVEPARRMWTAAAVLALFHAALAFDASYGWSHAAAFEDTARRTAAVTGVAWGGGLFVNYLFVGLWLADAAWWWVDPGGYLRRSMRIERPRAALFVFMFLNGAIVFASNTARIVGIPAVAAVCTAWTLGGRRRPARA